MILETSQLLSWGGAWDGRRGQRREFHTVQQSPVGSASHKLLCVCVWRGSGAVWVGRFTEPISVGTELVLYFPNPSVFKEETETEKKR